MPIYLKSKFIKEIADFRMEKLDGKILNVYLKYIMTELFSALWGTYRQKPSPHSNFI